MKTIEQHFADWESDTFGFGYGTGEEHVLRALQGFMNCLEQKHSSNWSYDYARLEEALTPPVTWLLINVLAHDDKIEYGTSPRFGWMTRSGEALRQFIAARTLEEILLATEQPEEYVECFPDHCNCSDGDCRPLNPFWTIRGAVSASVESK